MKKIKKYIFMIIIILIIFPSCKAKTPLEAIERGRLQDLKVFYKQGDNLKEIIHKDNTFLIYAIKNNFDDIALWIIRNKINDINKTDSMENTPIMIAYKNNREIIFNELLKQKAKLNTYNFNGLNLISIIAKNGDYKNFEKLVKKYKVKINFKLSDGLYEGYSIVEFAVSGGNLKILKHLKKRRFRIKSSSMLVAAEKGHIEMMTYLESLGIKMNSRNKEGWTTLMSAAKSGKEDAVMLILGYGANVNAKTNSKWTALMSAVMSKNIEIVKILVEAGAKINQKNNNGKNSIEIAIEEDSKDIANYLKGKIK